MARVPYAAKKFIEQARGIAPDLDVQYEDEDGFRVYRSLRFDKESSERLFPIVESLAAEDERIKDYQITDAGYLWVYFQTDHTADDATRFLFREAQAVTEDDTARMLAEVAEQEEAHADEPKPKQRARKKAQPSGDDADE